MMGSGNFTKQDSGLKILMEVFSSKVNKNTWKHWKTKQNKKPNFLHFTKCQRERLRCILKSYCQQKTNIIEQHKITRKVLVAQGGKKG